MNNSPASFRVESVAEGEERFLASTLLRFAEVVDGVNLQLIRPWVRQNCTLHTQKKLRDEREREAERER